MASTTSTSLTTTSTVTSTATTTATASAISTKNTRFVGLPSPAKVEGLQLLGLNNNVATPPRSPTVKFNSEGKQVQPSSPIRIVQKQKLNTQDVPTTTTTENPSQNDELILQLQANINLQMEKQNELIKQQFERIESRLPSVEFCSHITNFMQQTDAKTAELYGMCLKEQENIERIDKNLLLVYKKQKETADRLSRLETSISQITPLTTDNSTHIQSLRDEVDKFHTDIQQINTTNNIQTKQFLSEIAAVKSTATRPPAPHPSAGVIADIQSQIQRIAKELEAVAAVKNNIRSVHPPKQHKELSYDDKEITATNLLLVDSNGRKVDENRIADDPDFTCDKIYTPTWEDIGKLITQGTCENPASVQKIFVHVGTNNFDNADAVKVCNVMEEGVKQLRSTFTEATITLCTIVPRKNNKKKEDIDLVNDFLIKSKRRLGIEVIDLGRVKPSMCYDEKHLNNEGLRILVHAVIFTFTGLFPAISQRRGGGNNRRNNNNNYRGNNNNNRRNNNNNRRNNGGFNNRYNNNNNRQHNGNGQNNGDSDEED